MSQPLVVRIDGACEQWANDQVARGVALAHARFAEHVDAVSEAPKELAAGIERFVAGVG